MPHCGFFACSQTEPHPKKKGDAFASPMVGVRWFEHPTSWSRTKRSTKLSHTPKYKLFRKGKQRGKNQAHISPHSHSHLGRSGKPCSRYSLLGGVSLRENSHRLFSLAHKLSHTPITKTLYHSEAGLSRCFLKKAKKCGRKKKGFLDGSGGKRLFAIDIFYSAPPACEKLFVILIFYGREMPSKVLHYWNKSAKMNLISIFRER